MTPLSVGSAAGGHRQDADVPRALRRLPAPAVPDGPRGPAARQTVLNQLELLGGEVIPVLRKEIEARQDPETAPAPTHELLVKAKYGDSRAAPAAPEREPRRQRDRRVPVPGHGRGRSRPSTRRDLTAVADRQTPRQRRVGGAAHRPRVADAGGSAPQDVWEDLSMREYDVLYTLSKCPDPIRLTELNRHVLLSQPALSRMVDRLADRGLVSRDAPTRADGRGVRLALTDDGPGRAAPDRPPPRPLGRPGDARRAHPGRAPPARRAVREAGGSRRRDIVLGQRGS